MAKAGANIPTVSRKDGLCKSPALSVDSGTIFFDELEELPLDGEQIDCVCGKGISLKPDQWGNGYMSIYLNGMLVGKEAHPYGYVPSNRTYRHENILLIGYKSSCCMGEYGESSLYTDGTFYSLHLTDTLLYRH